MSFKNGVGRVGEVEGGKVGPDVTQNTCCGNEPDSILHDDVTDSMSEEAPPKELR